MTIITKEQLTDREREQMQFDQEMFDRQALHTQKVKAMEVEVAKIEAKWSVLLKLPIMVAKLPLYLVLGIAICIAVARKHEIPKELYALFGR